MKKALSAAMAAGMTAVMLPAAALRILCRGEHRPCREHLCRRLHRAAAESVVSAPTELSFVFADGDDNFKTEMNKIVDNFNAANPDITITIEPGDGGSYSEFLKTKDSVGEFPDMMEMRDTAMYVRAGKVAPLSDDVKALFTSTVEFDGVTYTAPMSGANTMGIMYNKKYFADNGLEIPKTWMSSSLSARPSRIRAICPRWSSAAAMSGTSASCMTCATPTMCWRATPTLSRSATRARRTSLTPTTRRLSPIWPRF